MAEPAVARPSLAFHAAVEFRFDPASAVRARRHRPRPLFAPCFQTGQLSITETSPAVAVRRDWRRWRNKLLAIA